MNKKLIAVFVLSFLVSFWLGVVVGAIPDEPVADTDFGPPLATECPETSDATFQIRLRDPEYIDAVWHQLGGPAGYTAQAFQAELDTGQKVLVLPPLRGQKDKERLKIWGHELGHIVCGDFHAGHQMGVE